MTESIVVNSIGTLGSSSGQISASYLADSGAVVLRASVPGDKRRADIVVHTGIVGLRQLLAKLEAAEEATKIRRKAHEGIASHADGVTLTVMGTSFIVANATYKRLGELMVAGQNDKALKVIRAEFPALAEKGVSDVAFLIYKQLRPRA